VSSEPTSGAKAISRETAMWLPGRSDIWFRWHNRRDQSSMAGMAFRSIADVARAVATGCLRANQRSVRSGAKDSDVPRVSRIVCATDAGREGELIFRYIYEATESKKPVSRLWISSLTPDAIRKGFDNLRPGHEYDRLADAASGRSRADWLVGMNLSRAYSDCLW